jgi:uncharacterized protein with ATP-grasp and redox domains
LKVSADCALCLFQRGYLEIIEATEDPELQLKAIQSLFRLLAENFRPSAVPAVIGTMREKMIKNVTGNPDPFAEKKRMSNVEALKILPLAEKLVARATDAESRFRKACLSAIVGNIIEFNIPGHELEFNNLRALIERAEEDLVIDNISKAYKIARDSRTIVYLTDNAGEIAFDTLLVKELKNLASKGRVIVAVKGEPAQNDATMEDAVFVGMDKVADSLVSLGAGCMGLILSECSRDFVNLYNSADFVVSKGMGNAETLTEMRLKAPHFLLLRTKCMNVAKYFRVPRDKNVAKLI